MSSEDDESGDRFTALQQQVVALRNDELLSAEQIAKRLGKAPQQIRKILTLPKVADATLEAARTLLMSSSGLAAKTLVDLLGHRSGYVQLQAAAAVLDRAGVIAPKEPAVRVKNVSINIVLTQR